MSMIGQSELRLTMVTLSERNGGGNAYRVEARAGTNSQWRLLEEYYSVFEASTDFNRRFNAMTSKKHRYLGRGE